METMQSETYVWFTEENGDCTINKETKEIYRDRVVQLEIWGHGMWGPVE